MGGLKVPKPPSRDHGALPNAACPQSSGGRSRKPLAGGRVDARPAGDLNKLSSLPHEDRPALQPAASVAGAEPLSPPRALEHLIAIGIVTGLAAITIETAVLDRFYATGLVVLGGVTAALSVVVGRDRSSSSERATAVVAFSYLSLAAAMSVWRDELTASASFISAVALTWSAQRARLDVLMVLVRNWLAAAVFVFMWPLLGGDGYEAGRTWLSQQPGRFFGFSNPNALSFLAGLLILLCLPPRRTKALWGMLPLGGILIIVTASWTALVALGAALVIFVSMRRRSVLLAVRWLIPVVAAMTSGFIGLIYTPRAIEFLLKLSLNFDFSARTYIWLSLVQRTRDIGAFWTGVGEKEVGRYATDISGVTSAHSTVLQILLSKGFVMALFFVFLVTLVSLTALRSATRAPNLYTRGVVAIIAYWFIHSLVSSTPGSAEGLTVIVALTVALVPQAEKPQDHAHQSAGRPGVPLGRSGRKSADVGISESARRGTK